MAPVTLSGLQKTGQFVTEEMFGANLVFQQTEVGAPTADYVDVADVLGVQNIRFGGGQADLDPTLPNAAGDLPVDGSTSINIVDMPGGELRPELLNFLEWCEARSNSGQPTTATLIIPTKHLDVGAYAAFADEIETFISAVMPQYGDVISAFQIGNEHWEMGETAYGIKASLAAEAIERGLLAAGLNDSTQPDILVQMATAGNAGSEFPATPGVSDFAARNDAANEQVIAQLSDAARDAIDGVTEHYYLSKTDYEFSNSGSNINNIDRDYEVWSQAFDKELDLFITEWNVKTTATAQQGMVAASSLIKQFEYMVDLGVDGANIWAFDYHSRTALTLETDDGARLDAQDRLTNSPQGAVIDMMSEALVGKELVTASFSSGEPGIDISAYASSNELVFYVMSRTLEETTFTLDLSDRLLAQSSVEAVLMSLDPTTSNGLQWEAGISAESVEIDGQPYFYNEHDVDVILTEQTFDDASQIDLTLKPFEFVELTIDLASAPAPSPPTPTPTPSPDPDPVDPVFPDLDSTDKHYYLGTEGDDFFVLTENVVYIDAGAGTDTVFINDYAEDATFTLDEFGKPELVSPAHAGGVTMANVERLEFVDGTLAFDREGTAGQAYRLYQASFDRKPDVAGLEFWVTQLDSGDFTLEEVASEFLKSEEFEKTYGKNDTLADDTFADLLYQNVLDRTADQAGYDFWRAQQENNVSRETILVSFSESLENKANVAPAIDDGIWYT